MGTLGPDRLLPQLRWRYEAVRPDRAGGGRYRAADDRNATLQKVRYKPEDVSERV
jgi:hypothetical protein